MGLIFQIIKGLINLIGIGESFPKKIRVTRIIDGDSLEGNDSNGKRHQIRIRGIDAPEMDQAHGYESKSALAEIAQGETLVLSNPERDKYNRIAAHVTTTRGENVAKSMLKTGNAWACPNRASMMQNLNETTAKIQSKGLWKKSNPKEPWKHRRDKSSPEM